MPRPDYVRAECGQAADRFARLVGVEVEGRMRNVRGVTDAGLRIERVEAIRDEGEAVLGPVETDQSGRVTRQVQDAEASDLLSLLDVAGELQRAAVPPGQQPRQHRPRPCPQQAQIPVI